MHSNRKVMTVNNATQPVVNASTLFEYRGETDASIAETGVFVVEATCSLTERVHYIFAPSFVFLIPESLVLSKKEKN